MIVFFFVFIYFDLIEGEMDATDEKSETTEAGRETGLDLLNESLGKI